ncbi:MAG: hypothetical protein JXA21_19250 [Anaerolineae bacterium]|nr:hypothetical protein [Anaerolineae bacterium]
MFDDFAVLKAENIEADLWAEKLVVRVSENILPILKHPDGFDFGRVRWELLQQFAKPLQPVGDGQVVLGVAVGVDGTGGLRPPPNPQILEKLPALAR